MAQLTAITCDTQAIYDGGMARPRRRNAKAGPARQARRSGCPISIALELLGDPWSLLIVRDLTFGGPRTFKDFRAAGEGIATNVLTDRLRRLEAYGIIARRRDETDRRRIAYRLTAKGIDLAPVLVELVVWSAAHEETAAPSTTIQTIKRDRDGYLRGLRDEWEKRES